MIQVVMPDWMDKRHGEPALLAFVEGLKKLRVHHKIISVEKAEPSYDPMVCWGVYKARFRAQRESFRVLQEEQKKVGDLLIVERGFVKREDYYSVSWKDLNGRGDYPHNEHVSGDRWRALGVQLEPWQTREGPIIVAGQVPWDTSCQEIDFAAWVKLTVHQLRQVYQGMKILFRPHPLQPTAVPTEALGVDGIDRSPLDACLRVASLVVTYSSTLGVDAVIQGVPVVACSPTSMASGRVASRSVLSPLVFPERLPWAHWLAYCQWSLRELRNGDAWRHFYGQR